MSAQRPRPLPWLGLLMALAVAGWLLADSGYSVLLGRTPSFPYHLQTVIPDAFEVIPGERVVAAGETIGEITSAEITRAGQAHLVIGIDSSAWPIPTNSVLTLRMGGTIKYTDRFIELSKGRADSEFGNGASVPPKQFVVPVEYDSLFNVFSASTRAGMRWFLDNAGSALTAAAPSLHSALSDSAPALGQVDAVFRDLSYDERALGTLVHASDDVVNAIANSNPGVRQLLSGAAGTFAAVSDNSVRLQAALVDAPSALQRAGHALYHLSSTLEHVSTLSDALAPGITQLRRIASPLDGTLHTVAQVSPIAVSTLNTIRAAAPDLDALLQRASNPLLPELAQLGGLGAKEVRCVRPYTPEILGAVSTWSSFWSAGDYASTYLTGTFGANPFENVQTQDMAALHKALPTVNAIFPQVPGSALDQPWYQPQCGITAASYDPSHNPQAHTFDPLGGKTVDYH